MEKKTSRTSSYDESSSFQKETLNKNEIPKVIHQMWIDKIVNDNVEPPQKYLNKGYPQSWKEFHPEWNYMFWNRDKVLHLFGSHPILRKYFRFIRKKIKKLIEFCDFARYGVEFAIGGLYADCDVKCVNAFDELVENSKDLLLFFEPMEHGRMGVKSRPLLWNGLLISAKENPFWIEWMDHIVKHYDGGDDVFYNTGPAGFSKFVQTRKYHIAHPEWFGNSCLVIPSLQTGKICKQCIPFFQEKGEPPVNNYNFYYYEKKNANKPPFNKVLSYTLWSEGSFWGKLTLGESDERVDFDKLKSVESDLKDEVAIKKPLKYEDMKFNFLQDVEFENRPYYFLKYKKILVVTLAVVIFVVGAILLSCLLIEKFVKERKQKRKQERSVQFIPK